MFQGSDCVDMFSRAASLLPEELKSAICKFSTSIPEEIRLRLGRPPTVVVGDCERLISDLAVDKRTLDYVIERASGASLHSHMDEIVRGYLNCNGLRIGLCGTAIIKNGELAGFKNFSSLSIRIPALFSGDIETIYRKVSSSISSCLIVSPPGGGKTTLLREMIRRFSVDGKRVSVVDERNEISATEQGRAHYDLGPCSDILAGVGKREGTMLLLRTMNPQIIALDEISHKEDMEAVLECAGCGVSILATAHGRNLNELRERSLYRKLLDEHMFEHLICIENTKQGRNYGYMRLDT